MLELSLLKCVRARMHVHMCVFLSVCTYVHGFVQVCVCLNSCLSVSMHACLYLFMLVYMHKSVHECLVCVHAHACFFV